MKVTVITPVLNGVKTIAECIKSVQLQTHDDIEHIVVDGGSTDGTLEIVNALGVDLCISGKDSGVYEAFSKGISKASGDVINILNADDFYAEYTVIERVISKLQIDNSDLCHGYILQIDQNNMVIKKVGKALLKPELLQKMRVAHPSVFVRKQVYEHFGNFSQGFKVAGDHEFLLRVWDKVTISFLPQVLVKMRLGGVSNSQVELSYRESMAAAILHGANPLKAVARYYYELLKNKLL